MIRLTATEHEEQKALMLWARAMEGTYPDLHYLHAIPNGGLRHAAVARKLQAEGVKPGVPDLCLPVPKGRWHGLYIELKAQGGRLTEKQREWLFALRVRGYHAVVCVGWEKARQVIEAYLRERTI